MLSLHRQSLLALARRMRRRRIWRLAEDPDAPTVGVSIDKTEAHVGDRLTLTVSAVAKAGIAVMLPAKLDTGKLEVLDRNDSDKSGPRPRRRAPLAPLRPRRGRLRDRRARGAAARGHLPDAAGRGAHASQTEPLTVNVRPLVAADEAHPEPQPERPPRSAWVEDERVMRIAQVGRHRPRRRLVLLVAGAAHPARLAAAHAGGAWRRRPTCPSAPPDAVAIEKLTALRAAGNFGADGYRPFYFALAEIVREYLGARYGFDSLEMTTTEVLDELQGARRAPGRRRRRGAALLRDSDLVKFAKAGSTDAAALAALDAAQAIVLSTAAPLEEAAQSISRAGAPAASEVRGARAMS